MDPAPNPSSTAGNGGLSAAGATATVGNALTPIANACVSGGNGAAAADSADNRSKNLQQVINSVDMTLGLLHQLYLTVSSFSVASQLPLIQRLNALVAELDTMQKLAENCDIQVPMEVVNLIDDGKNPDEFTRDVLNSCIAKNQITKGKTDAFKSLRKYLLEEIKQAFPHEVENYREIRASSAALNCAVSGNKFRA
uniref:Mediator of RNA polymerase II transcription subunit 10 n=1 Tax=Elaeis guineensis var. tenera TaxID=51953 RepID=A0A8N4EWY1_ELAGV|nr:mediator of RNA polymerase II transcription subunit 10b isoform X2 [Elaeis guineensis]